MTALFENMRTRLVYKSSPVTEDVSSVSRIECLIRLNRDDLSKELVFGYNLVDGLVERCMAKNETSCKGHATRLVSF